MCAGRELRREKQGGVERAVRPWQLTNPADVNRGIWLKHPRGAGPVLVAVSLCSISQAGRHGTASFAPGAPHLKSSSRKEMSRFAFSYWSREECSSLHYTVHSGLPQACLWARTVLKTPVSFPFKCTLQTNLFGGFQKRQTNIFPCISLSDCWRQKLTTWFPPDSHILPFHGLLFHL